MTRRPPRLAKLKKLVSQAATPQVSKPGADATAAQHRAWDERADSTRFSSGPPRTHRGKRAQYKATNRR
jgi:hypothetical protein